jgi:SAM-dependent methyltransferase
MITQMKSFGRAVAPRPVTMAWGRWYGAQKIRRARAAFESTNPACAATYIGVDEFTRLMEMGFRPPDPVRYDAEGLALRATEKIGQLSARVPLRRCRTVLELGCWDGMVLSALREHGHTAYGADWNRGAFDARARGAGARLVQSDAAALGIAPESVDLVYSFAAFEHFSNPSAVLDEAWRVLRRGGYLYLLFGPVYTSPYGRHAYREIPIPYCHYLLPENELKAWAAGAGLPADWPYVNGVTVTDYRQLFERQRHRFKPRYYREHPTGGVGAELIAAYPLSFRNRVPSFDDLLVSGIEVCLRKK